MDDDDDGMFDAFDAEPLRSMEGKPIADLLAFARRWYPFATIDFSGGGQISIDIGISLRDCPVGTALKIKTPFYEGENGTLRRLP